LFARALSAFITLNHKRGIVRVLEGFAYLGQSVHDFEAR
jgi:hypothetical protein